MGRGKMGFPGRAASVSAYAILDPKSQWTVQLHRQRSSCLLLLSLFVPFISSVFFAPTTRALGQGSVFYQGKRCDDWLALVDTGGRST